MNQQRVLFQFLALSALYLNLNPETLSQLPEDLQPQQEQTVVVSHSPDLSTDAKR